MRYNGEKMCRFVFRKFVKICCELDISLQHPFFVHPIQIKLEIKIYPIEFVDPGEDPTLLKLVKDLFLDEKTSDFEVGYLSSTRSAPLSRFCPGRDALQCPT